MWKLTVDTREESAVERVPYRDERDRQAERAKVDAELARTLEQVP